VVVVATAADLKWECQGWADPREGDQTDQFPHVPAEVLLVPAAVLVLLLLHDLVDHLLSALDPRPLVPDVQVPVRSADPPR